jgi:hypothetical protein
MYPSLSVNLEALLRLLEVDMNPYIYMKSPAFNDLKSRFLSLAPL